MQFVFSILAIKKIIYFFAILFSVEIILGVRISYFSEKSFILDTP